MKTGVRSQEKIVSSRQYAVSRKTIYCLLPTPYCLLPTVICLLLTVYCLLPLKSYAEEEGVKEENAPIKITSGRMETQNGKNVVSFMENVVAKKGDMTIYANRLDVYSDKDKKKLIKIIAEGDVRIEKGLKTATGATAEYYDEGQKLILRGNPKLKEKDNLIEGSEIIYYIKEENVTVHGDEKKKVEVTLFPEEKKTGVQEHE